MAGALCTAVASLTPVIRMRVAGLARGSGCMSLSWLMVANGGVDECPARVRWRADFAPRQGRESAIGRAGVGRARLVWLSPFVATTRTVAHLT